LVRQLEDHSNKLKEVQELLKKDRAEIKGQIKFSPSPDNYFWSHGFKVAKIHTSQRCNYPKSRHKREAAKDDNMGGSQAIKE
jgi:hypothetical protein